MDMKIPPCIKCGGNISKRYDRKLDMYYYKCDNCGVMRIPQHYKLEANFNTADGKTTL